MTAVLEFIASLILVSLLIPTAIFVVRYFLYSPYDRSREGRNLLREKIAIGGLLIAVTLTAFLGTEYPGRPFVRLVVFSALAYFFWIEVALLIRVQRAYPYRRFPRKTPRRRREP